MRNDAAPATESRPAEDLCGVDMAPAAMDCARPAGEGQVCKAHAAPLVPAADARHSGEATASETVIFPPCHPEGVTGYWWCKFLRVTQP